MSERRRVVGAFDDVDDAEQAHEDLGGEVDADADADIALSRDRGDSAERPPDTTVAFEVDGEGQAEAVTEDLVTEGADVVQDEPADDR